MWHLAEYSDSVFLYENNAIENNTIDDSLCCDCESFCTCEGECERECKCECASNDRRNNQNNVHNNDGNNCSDNDNIFDKNNKNKKNSENIEKHTDRWTLLEARLLVGRSSHACVGFKGKLWIAGTVSTVQGPLVRS